MPYTISNRVPALLTGPLTHKYFSNPTSRFLWVNEKPYVSPNWSPGQLTTAKMRVNTAKMPIRRVNRAL
jgi:hypothetical protein